MKIDKRIVSYLVLVAIALSLFAWSVVIRNPYFDKATEGHHHHLTSHSMLFTNNWLKDGIVESRFSHIYNPSSIEFKNVKERTIYDSYPTGGILPLYFLAKVMFKKEITLGFVQAYNLFGHLMLTLLLFSTIFVLLQRLKFSLTSTILFSLIPIISQLFFPAPFYFLQNIYFNDIAVLLPFAVVVFLETVKTKNEKLKKWLKIIEAVAIFYGCFTDYLFLFVIFVVYMKKWIMGEFPKGIYNWFLASFEFLLPAILSILLFIAQIAWNGPNFIIDKFFERTGASDGGGGWTKLFHKQFWDTYIRDGYGQMAQTLIFISFFVVLTCIVFYLIRALKKKNKPINLILSTAAMILLPCMMQVYALRQHSAIHDFSTAKFSLVMSTVPFVLLPILVLYIIYDFLRIKEINPKTGKLMKIHQLPTFRALCITFSVVLFTLNSIYVVTTHDKYAKGFFPQTTPHYKTEGEFIKKNTGFENVVFTNDGDTKDNNNDYVITDIRPQALSQSMKRVYAINDVEDIVGKVSGINGEYVVTILDVDGRVLNPEKLQNIFALSYETVKEGPMTLYKIKKQDFLNYFK